MQKNIKEQFFQKEWDHLDEVDERALSSYLVKLISHHQISDSTFFDHLIVV